MGYESRFYIVKKSDFSFNKDTNKRWAELIASFNMCKCYDLYERIKHYPKTDCYFFNGNKEVTEDKYGDPLIEIPINDMIEIVTKVMKDDSYRRYNPFLSLLKGFNLNEWNSNLVVLHYGY